MGNQEKKDFIDMWQAKWGWYHSIDLGDGIITPGMFDHRKYLRFYGLPESLEGKRVLDLGTADGFFAFELERRGAEEIMAVDIRSSEAFTFSKKILKSKVQWIQESIYDLSPEKIGTFDLVFCGSLLLHLDDIVGAVKKMWSLTRGTCIVASGYLDTGPVKEAIFYPHLTNSFVRLSDDESDDAVIRFPVTWFGNQAAYERLFDYAGFSRVKLVSTFDLEPVRLPKECDEEGHKAVSHIVVMGERGKDGAKGSERLWGSATESGTPPVVNNSEEEQITSISEKISGVRSEVTQSPPEPLELQVFTAQDKQEGKTEAVPSSGEPYVEISAGFPIISRLPYLGWLSSWTKRMIRRQMNWLIEPILDQINAVLNVHEGYVHALKSDVNGMKSDVNGMKSDVNGMKSDVNNMQNSLTGLNEIITIDTYRKLMNGHIQMAALFEHLKDSIDTLEKSGNVMKNEVAGIREEYRKIADLKLLQRLGRYERLVRRLNERIDAGSGGLPRESGTARALVGVPAEPLSLDYYLFEEKFRGDSISLSKNQEEYVEFFRDRKNVLDIGCGRGEFLELLQKEDVEAYGIDTNGDMVDLCREKGLEAYRKDVFEHLQSLDDGSLGGIFMAQVPEHLSATELVRLLELSFEKLRHGGVFVAETLNPDSLASLEYFYLDPSHTRMISARTFEFLLDSAGFSGISSKFLHSVPEQAKLHDLNAEEGGQKFQDMLFRLTRENFQKINERLFGDIDYVVSAIKPPPL